MEVGLSVSSGQKKTGQKELIDLRRTIEYDLYLEPKQISLTDDWYGFDTNSLFYQLKNNLLCCDSGIDLHISVEVAVTSDYFSQQAYLVTKKIHATSTITEYLTDLFVLNPENIINIESNKVSINYIITNINHILCANNEYDYLETKVLRLISANTNTEYIDIIFDPKTPIPIPAVIDYRNFTIPSRVFPISDILLQGMLHIYEYTPYEITPD